MAVVPTRGPRAYRFALAHAVEQIPRANALPGGSRNEPKAETVCRPGVVTYLSRGRAHPATTKASCLRPDLLRC